MHPRPDAPALLDVARETLLDEETLAAVPDAVRYRLRMAANAMAIAAREVRAGDADVERHLALLGDLYGADVVEAAGRTPAERASAMQRRLARDIRDGVLDGACAPGVRALLLEQVRRRLAVSNPRHLRASGLDEG
ncbi:MAG: hypothetical protein H6983_06690 [Ectothiorhodospiraceae bacterium]|nr:hypothetical protein [Chromatiales bacterium]MCP5153833.1 hypothetical protein [Ectothiorhodospiraceae bacterium]